MAPPDLRFRSDDDHELTEASQPLVFSAPAEPPDPRGRGGLRAEVPFAVPGLLAVGLFLVWAVHDGGFDEDTWYWGALAMLALAEGTFVGLGSRRRPLPRTLTIAIALFAGYVGWSYLSMIWADNSGLAWEGSNRALLYLLTFIVMSIVPWTPRTAMAALLAYAIGVGATASVLIIRIAGADRLPDLFQGDRLLSPTGYINSTAALLTMGALVAVGLASRAELRGAAGGLMRGLLLGFATLDLDLAITAQSRGWLFTLPIVGLFAIFVCRDRLAVTAAAVLPVAGTALAARRLLKMVSGTSDHPLAQFAPAAGHRALLLAFAVFVVGTLMAWATGIRPIVLRPAVRRLVGVVFVTVALVGVAGVTAVVSHGRPGHFISDQWDGFTHGSGASAGSHFDATGSGRYDFWRVGLEAFTAHPIGGLGQDNFLDYYILHRKTGEEPLYVHSLEIRMLAHTGIVGFVLFFAFLACAIAIALRARRRGDALTKAVTAIAMLPVIVWVIHGSIDWFWEVPALSGPALGFLGMGGALAAEADPAPRDVAATNRRPWPVRVLGGTVGAAALLAAVGSLAFPYWSVREVSVGSYIQNLDPDASLAAFKRAGELNPLDSGPGISGGAVAIRNHRWKLAEAEFNQALDREPGNWVSWLGAGLAASEQGDRVTAKTDFRNAVRINPLQTADLEALRRVDSARPLGAVQGLNMLTEFDK